MQLISDKTVPELLELHARVLEELRARNVVWTESAPSGDYAEYLFCKAFGWHHFGNARNVHDAEDDNRMRYQIKGRRIVAYNSAPQLSAIRSSDQFDYLAAVLFDENYHVSRAAIIPMDIVRGQSHPHPYTNKLTFYLQDFVWDVDGVMDVTAPLRQAEAGRPVASASMAS